MIFGILTLITALSISAVAIYYSVAGLVAIFAAAAWPIIIMGSILEIAKLVTAVWLHKYWDKAVWWLKTYLSIATVVLMFITSMGIFGFLSKAHIEQTAGAVESVAQIERIDTEINRNKALIARNEEKIVALENTDNNKDDGIQEKINIEQDRIDSAYARQQPAIDQQNQIIQQELQRLEQQLIPYNERLAQLNEQTTLLQQYIDNGEIKKLQGIIGAQQDGQYGPNTARKVEDFRQRLLLERDETVARLDELRSAESQAIINARAEINRLRGVAEQQIATSNQLIDRLRSELGQGQQADTTGQIEALQAKTVELNASIDTLFERKFELEAENRKLEAEVGPIKYVAEFIYGENADNNMLEEAVRWMIILIIFVFDPLAVLLLISSQYTFEYARKEKDDNTNNNATTDDISVDRRDAENEVPTEIQPEPIVPDTVPEESITEEVIDNATTDSDEILIDDYNDWNDQEIEEVAEEILEEIVDDTQTNNDIHTYITKENNKQVHMAYVPSNKTK